MIKSILEIAWEIMSAVSKFNGRVNGIGEKTPFLIGVAGGTASGKVKINN